MDGVPVPQVHDLTEVRAVLEDRIEFAAWKLRAGVGVDNPLSCQLIAERVDRVAVVGVQVEEPPHLAAVFGVHLEQPAAVPADVGVAVGGEPDEQAAADPAGVAVADVEALLLGVRPAQVLSGPWPEGTRTLSRCRRVALARWVARPARRPRLWHTKDSNANAQRHGS